MIIIKRFLKWSKIHGYYNGTAHENFKASGKDITLIFLEFDELKKLYYYPFEDPKLDRARDKFCFGCLTGLRGQDLKILRWDHIVGRFIYFAPQKTLHQKKVISVIIPIVDAAQRILDKYNDRQGRIFREVCATTYLEQIEKCCEMAGIDSTFEKVDLLANNTPVRVRKEKYKFITGHTSRKTFMTLSRSMGVDRDIITSITGHSDGNDKNVNKYMGIDKDLKFTALSKAWKVLYQAPGSEDPELSETEKLKKEIEELKKIIEAHNTGYKESHPLPTEMAL